MNLSPNQEKQRRYGQLNVFEKIILSFVQFAVGNKTARLFVFFYAVLGGSNSTDNLKSQLTIRQVHEIVS